MLSGSRAMSIDSIIRNASACPPFRISSSEPIIPFMCDDNVTDASRSARAVCARWRSPSAAHAAAWAALGDRQRAQTALAERLASVTLSSHMNGMMGSLLEILNGGHAEALRIIESMDIARDPESMFYMSRHLA